VRAVRTDQYRYNLPRDLIAQYPLERGRDRLLIADRKSRRIEHHRFEDLGDYLTPDDLLVFNDTRVIPARLMGRKSTGGKVEVLLVRRVAPERWSCLLRASKPSRPGTEIFFENNLRATVEGRDEEFFVVSFSDPGKVLGAGRIPLPPYIERDPEVIDTERYQTVYARKEGSVAAPTAGLHFTTEFMEKLRSRGVGTAFITLHVGPGTFVPVKTEEVEDHRMHAEAFVVSAEAASAISSAMAEGKRVVAVGTTTTRVLEYLMATHGEIAAGTGSADLFIYQGFRFRCVSALLTNFHLPCSTLLMLVTAFGGYDFIMDAYRSAVEKEYRFFSYGDAMLII
jgi:S-adenosylmethionine:tRNA ribosyltransferase-isomerase